MASLNQNYLIFFVVGLNNSLKLTISYTILPFTLRYLNFFFSLGSRGRMPRQASSRSVQLKEPEPDWLIEAATILKEATEEMLPASFSAQAFLPSMKRQDSLSSVRSMVQIAPSPPMSFMSDTKRQGTLSPMRSTVQTLPASSSSLSAVHRYRLLTFRLEGQPDSGIHQRFLQQLHSVRRWRETTELVLLKGLLRVAVQTCRLRHDRSVATAAVHRWHQSAAMSTSRLRSWRRLLAHRLEMAVRRALIQWYAQSCSRHPLDIGEAIVVSCWVVFEPSPLPSL